MTLDPHSLGDVLASVVDVGDALSATERAETLVESLRARLDALGTLLAGVPSTPVLALEWTDPAFTAGHWVPDVVGAGGGHAVLASPGADSRRLGWEAVRAAAAEVVLVAPCGYHLDDAARLAEQLVADDRLPPSAEVWAVDADSHFVRPGPRLVDGAETVARILHPEVCGAPPLERARRVATGPSVNPTTNAM